MNYVELYFSFENVDPWRDIAISELAEMGFESFVETKIGLKSYIAENKFKELNPSSIENIKGIVEVEQKLIHDQNWNEKWESSFDPVLVEDKIVIRAPFHTQRFNVPLEIVIQPQMSFGTGHHQTTWLMCKRMMELSFKEKEVLDMGTGTGVLAILADKLGAKYVFAPDIDEWSYKNAQENLELNNCKVVEVALGDDQLVGDKKFDIILANINKNVLIEQFSVYSRCLNSGGKLLISGFFQTDEGELKEVATELGFIFEDIQVKDEWALMQFKH